MSVLKKRSWVFAIGFALGLLIFVLANVVSYRQMFRGPDLTDLVQAFGFPFEVYRSGGFNIARISWGGVVADVLIAACGSILLGWLAEVVFRKYAGQRS